MQTMRQCWAVRSPGCARPTAMSSPVAVPPQGELLRRPHRRVAQAAAAAGGSGPEGRGNSSSSSSGAGGSRRAAAPAAGSVEQEEVLKLVALLPLSVRQSLEQHPQLPQLLEVVMDLGRVPIARFPGGDQRLSEAVVTAEDLQYAVDQVGEFGGDNRGGIDRTLHRISCIRNRAGRVVGLTCRVGRAIEGSAAMAADLAREGKSILLLGRPGVGKTTAIREIARLLADECRRRVVVVDTSNEIGGDGDIPHPGLGRARRMQVPRPEQQHRVMVEAVENHFPEVIVIDEIGTEAECLAARTIAQRGVQLVATAHGNELENVMKNPSLADLVGGISSVTLGDEEARRRGVQKSVLERQSPPTFDACIEMRSREQWRVHLDVGWAVDSVLLGKEPGAEVRERDDSGKVWSWPEGGSTDFEDSSDEEDGPGGEAGAISASSSSSSSAQQQRRQVETQPFPPEALSAARLGAAMQAAQGAPLAPRAAAAASVFGGTNSGTGSGAVPAKPGSSKKAGSGGSSSRAGGSAGSAAGAVHVYCFGLEGANLAEIAQSLGVSGSLVLADRLQDADAVLALRSKIKTSNWIKGAAAIAGIPVYSIKSASVSNLVRAVRTLLGIDPSPGALFAADEAAPAAADPRARTSTSRTLRAETSIALAQAADVAAASGGSGGGSSGGGAAANRQDALEEARLAAEQIVIPRGQPVELLPRDLDTIDAQALLVEEFGLPYEVVGGTASLRLRVLPPAWASRGPDAGSSATPSSEGARKKEFW